MLRHVRTLASVATLGLAACAAHAAPPSVLQKALVPDMLDADLAYFERIAGAARNTYGDQKIYKIGTCEVEVNTARGKIQWFEVEATPACAFDLWAFVPNAKGNRVPITQLTMGHLDNVAPGGGEFSASCLAQCGNAADPVVYQRWAGGRADGMVEVRFGVVLADDAALDASEKWEQAMLKKHPQDWLVANRFNCAQDAGQFQPVARAAFRNVKVSTVAVGRNIPQEKCE
jgi:hypothetical protein